MKTVSLVWRECKTGLEHTSLTSSKREVFSELVAITKGNGLYVRKSEMFNLAVRWGEYWLYVVEPPISA